MFYAQIDPLAVLFHFVSWILFVWFIIWLLRRISRRHHMWCEGGMCNHSMHNAGALEILRERYAKGEIKTEEFEEKKCVLMQ